MPFGMVGGPRAVVVISSFIKIGRVVCELWRRGRKLPYPLALHCPVAYATTCITLQAAMSVGNRDTYIGLV